MKKVLLLFLLSVSAAGAQSLRMGFQFEAYYFTTKSEGRNVTTDKLLSTSISKNLSLFPLSLYLKIGPEITKTFSIDLRGGFIFAGEYTGFEAGVFPKYFFYKNISVIGFYMYHYNTGFSSTKSKGYNTNIELLGLGVGLKLSETTTLELLYSKPITDALIHYSYHPTEGLNRYGKLYVGDIFKLGLGFSWSLVDF